MGGSLVHLSCLLGAWWAGLRYYEPVLFLLYGLVGGMLVGTVFLPDARDGVAIARGSAGPGEFIFAYMACAIAAALSCLLIGRIASKQNERRECKSLTSGH